MFQAFVTRISATRTISALLCLQIHGWLPMNCTYYALIDLPPVPIIEELFDILLPVEVENN